MENSQTVTYRPSPTLAKFHADNSFVRAILGPLGSGKSVACSVEIMRRAVLQAPFNNVRKSKFVVVRNTYRELIDTTIRTFFDWFPQDLGHMRAIDLQWKLNTTLQDNTQLDLEILFRALDRPDDIKKLLSLELTAGWLNEAREIPREVLDMLQGRVGRFPSKREGGPSWFGVILDTNAPDSDSWFYKMFEETKPANFKLFRQPSGLSPEAENLDNLPVNYYQNIMQGKNNEWCNVYIHGRYGFIAEGRAVFPEYTDELHSTDDELLLLGGTIYVGADWGLTPAAVIGQVTASGQLQIIDELVSEDMGAVSFGKVLNELLQNKYCGCVAELYGDPAGEQRSQTDEQTVFQIMQNQGLDFWPTYTNDFTIRREAVAERMQSLTMGGKPAFILDRKQCPTLRKALSGGYTYRRLQISGEQRFKDVPDKGKYSHVADALQYLVLGALGGDRIIGGYTNKPAPKLDYSDLDRRIM